MVNSSIFKAYDIRGVYPDEINEEVVFKIAQAFVLFLQKKQRNWKKIVVSRDNRLSSSLLCKAVIKGIRAAGADVIDIGLAPTPMFYFAVAHYGFDGGIQVSASHNPAQFNGLKIVREKAISVGEGSGLQEIRRFSFEGRMAPITQEGRLIHKNVLGDYVNFQFQDFRTRAFKHLRIVIDTANAVPGLVVPRFMKKLGIKLVHINAKLDGRFPAHPPDPLRPENFKPLQAAVKKYKADLGVAFDGDGDRIIFCDEKGKAISSDIITALIATIILRSNPGAKIAYDVRSSRSTEEAIRENGGIPRVSRVGHSFIKAQMRKENIIFAGEFSGHFYHKDHYFCEAPFWVLGQVLQEMAGKGKSLSKIASPLVRYFSSGELNFEVEDKEGVMKKLEHRFRRGKVSKIDGVRVDFRDWWFLARPSNTENLLRLSIEAKTKKLLEEKKKILKRILKRYIETH